MTRQISTSSLVRARTRSRRSPQPMTMVYIGRDCGELLEWFFAPTSGGVVEGDISSQYCRVGVAEGTQFR